MLSLLILAILAIGFIVGLRRGLLLQLIHIGGFAIAFIVAMITYEPLSDRLFMWIPFPSGALDSSVDMLFDLSKVEAAFYNAIAFILIFIAVKILLQIIASLFDFLASFPLLKSFNHILGALLGVVEFYVIILMILFVFAMLPLDGVQNAIQGSFMAEQMITHTLILSNVFENLWF